MLYKDFIMPIIQYEGIIDKWRASFNNEYYCWVNDNIL